MKYPYNYMAFPEECLLEKRVYKKLFYENSDFSVTDKKWFTQDIESITWLYTLKPELIMIQAFEEGNYTYNEVVVVEVEVDSFEHTERLSEIIHRSIPYPLFIVFRQKEKVCLSVSDKRYSLTDDQAATINELWITDPINADDLKGIEQEFIEQLNFNNQPQVHLKAFYHGWLDAFHAFDISQVTGEYEIATEQEKKERRRLALEEYRELGSKIRELKRELNKENSFSNKMELNVEIKETQNQLKKVEEKL